MYARLIVTSDTSGSIKIWSLEKRFLREISFPHAIDSVCFLNDHGDILVSHVQRISKIRFETYWTTSFTHFGITQITDPIHLKYKELEASIETEAFDDHIFAKPPPNRLRAINNELFDELGRVKNEDETVSQGGGGLSKAEDGSTKSTLRQAGAALMGFGHAGK